MNDRIYFYPNKLDRLLSMTTNLFTERKIVVKKGICRLVLVLVVVLSVGQISVHATSRSTVFGGWSESKGYYINDVPGYYTDYADIPDIKSEISVCGTGTGTPADKPESHTGKRLSRVIENSGDIEEAAYGKTKWANKYHYTTARMELSDGTVKTTSGRQWGWNETEATSPYYYRALFENTEARSYWGSQS